jgi:hypothetical protein
MCTRLNSVGHTKLDAYRQRASWPTTYSAASAYETTAANPSHERLRARSRGQLCGEGIWLLRAAGDLTDVTYVWRVELSSPWMRWLAPLLAPLFRWNHAGVMRAGEAGLTRYLAGPPGPRG